ncbi:hypothetical protein JCM11641_002142 [Rhodosporidiobolus odoratus]
MGEPLRARRQPNTVYPPDPYSSSPPISHPSSFARPASTNAGDRPVSLTNRSSAKRSIHVPDSKRSRTFWSNCGGGLEGLQKGETRVLLGLTLLGSVVRYWKIGRPGSVVFDEVHFGGFANKYIQSRFFMDVHPPLAKLLITLVAWLAGFQGGSFDFKDIGREYGPDHVPYIAMRLLPATLGLALIPLTYLTLRALHLRPATALLGSLFVTFENGLITQSRFILLDSPLIFFTALTVFFWIGFSNENDLQRDKRGRVGPFSRRWWIWLTLTGLSLGAVVSCKWVGLFTIATVGVYTVLQLWLLLGDLRVPIPLLFRHFVARALCLIVVPALFYLAMFAIHFRILDNSGEGDGFMSSEFQHTLKGHGMEDTFADVMVGSSITLRHLHTQGGYLHSHPSTYPGGSKQQQITLYPHRDDNNLWLVLNSTKNPDIPDPQQHAPPTPITDHQTILFHHPSTHKKLHSHDIRPPVSEVDYQNEVSAYGFEGFDGDANDHWVIEFDHAESQGRQAKKTLQTLRTRFRLRHLLTGCYLFSHKVKLPDWGFEQQEVTCNKNPSHENSIWYVETNTHPMLPSTSPKLNYRRPGFLSKFFELQAVMWQTNQGLTDRHAYDSRPHSWPVLLRGINFWVKDHRQIYLIGNPFVWALSTLSVVAYVAARGLLILRAQRGYKDFAHSQVVFYDRVCTFLVTGWFLHYFPFFLMGRQLFLHHYFPALYFALLLTATAFDLGTSFLRPRVRLQVVTALVVVAVYAWWYLSPLAYAGKADYEPHTTSLTDLHPSASSTTSIAAQVQPGRQAFAPVDKAPASSAIPEPIAHKNAAYLRDAAGDDKPLFVDVSENEAEEAEDVHEKKEEGGTTAVVADQPALPPAEGDEGLGVAIPQAAEGTSGLPVLAIVQAEEGGGGKAAPQADSEKDEGKEAGEEAEAGRPEPEDADLEDLEVEPVEEVEEEQRREEEEELEREVRKKVKEAARKAREDEADIALGMEDDVEDEDE